MAIAKVADRATDNGNAAVTTVDLPLSGMTVGNVLLIRTAADNSGGGGAARSIAVSNQSGTPVNVAAAVAYQHNNDPGAASAGVTVNIIAVPITATSGTIRLTYGGSVVQACVAEEWSGVDVTDLIVGTPVGASGVASANYGSATEAGIAAGNVAYAAVAVEGPSSDTFTQDADTTNGSWVGLTRAGTTNATADTNQTIAGAYKAVTGAGAQTYNPTGTARDSATLIVELAAMALTADKNASDTGTGTDAVSAQTRQGSETGAGTDVGTKDEPGSDLPVQTNMLAHYRAEKLSALADGDPVTAWPGQGTSSYDAAQATSGNRPTLQTNEANGLPVVRFDGTDDWLETSGTFAGEPGTVIAVVKLSSADPPSVEQTILGSSAGSGFQWRVATDLDVELMESGTQRIGTSTDATKKVVVGQLCVLSLTYDAAGNYEFRKNGAVSGSGTFDTTLSAGTLQIGRYGVGGIAAEHWTGDIAELAVFNAELSSGDLTSNEDHLLAKYALGGAVAKSASDSGTGTDAVSAQARGGAETGAGVDTAAVAVPITAAETGTGVDTTTAQGRSIPETGTGADSVGPQVRASTETGTGVDAPGAQARASTDAGVGTDTTSAQARSSSDSALGTDAGTLGVAATGSETGTSTDATPAQGRSVPETGAGVDLLSAAGRAAVDSGAGTDAGSSTTAATGTETGSALDVVAAQGRAPVETGSGSDAPGGIVLSPVSDSGTGSDSASVEVGLVNISADDAGIGTDAAAVTAVSSGTETGTGSDAGTVAAAASGTDSGSGVDAGSLAVAVAGTETGLGTDQGSVLAQGADKVGTETGTSTETAGVAAALSSSDTGSSVDGGAAQALISASETGSGTDTTPGPAVTVSASDSGTASDALAARGIASADLGEGVDVSTLAALVVTLDAGTGTDSAGGQGRASFDLGVGVDLASVFKSGGVAGDVTLTVEPMAHVGITVEAAGTITLTVEAEAAVTLEVTPG